MPLVGCTNNDLRKDHVEERSTRITRTVRSKRAIAGGERKARKGERQRYSRPGAMRPKGERPTYPKASRPSHPIPSPYLSFPKTKLRSHLEAAGVTQLHNFLKSLDHVDPTPSLHRALHPLGDPINGYRHERNVMLLVVRHLEQPTGILETRETGKMQRPC